MAGDGRATGGAAAAGAVAAGAVAAGVRRPDIPDLATLDIGADGVAQLTLRNPPLNLITLQLTARLIDLCADIAADPGIRALVITGDGDRAFCAGADVTEFADVRGDVVDRKLRRENEAMSAVEALPIPTIAAIGGVCLGGGAELALACDLRIIDEEARIGFPEVGLGVFPGSGGVFRLPRAVGLARALDLLYSGRLVGADEAHRIGLVTDVAPHGQVLARARARAAVLASRPALALQLIKSGAYASLTQTTQQAVAASLSDSTRVFTGPDIEEGLAAFFGKRTARFTAPRPVDQAPDAGAPGATPPAASRTTSRPAARSTPSAASHTTEEQA